MANPRSPNDIDLMCHADGELGGDAPLGASLDPSAERKLESLAQVGELVRGSLEIASDAIPEPRFARMWREVDRSIDPRSGRGVWSRLSNWFDHHRGHVLTGAITAGAVAVVAMLVAREAPPSAPVVETNGSRSLIDVQPAAMRSAPVIEDLQTPGGTGTLLNIEDEEGHMTVILVTPADTVEGI